MAHSTTHKDARTAAGVASLAGRVGHLRVGIAAGALAGSALLVGCVGGPAGPPTTVPAVLERVVDALIADHPGAHTTARIPHDGAVAARTVWIAGRPADVEVYPTVAALEQYLDIWQAAPGTLRCLQTGPTDGPGPTWSVDTTDEVTARAVDNTLIPLGDGGFSRDDDRPHI
jgi:hypothetical protein